MFKRLWLVLITIVVVTTLIVVIGCRGEPESPSGMPPDPFSSTLGLGENRMVTFSGNRTGHGIGEQSDFEIKLLNRVPDKPWQGEYCVFLITQDGTALPIAYDNFSVSGGVEIRKIISLHFDNLEGPYGLSVLIPGLGQSINTIWIGEKAPASFAPWPVVRTCPRYLTEEANRELAEGFVRNSPTFVFDGIEESLELVETLYPDIENAWQFVFRFKSRHAGYGDRTDEQLLQVITPHEVIITMESGEVKTALMDGKWDMLKQSRIAFDIEDVTWVLTTYSSEMGTHPALADVEVTLILNSAERQLGGVAGCNHYGAPYEINRAELRIVDYIIQTEMFCGDKINEQEVNYLQALQAAENYEVDGDKMTITGGGWNLSFIRQY